MPARADGNVVIGINADGSAAEKELERVRSGIEGTGGAAERASMGAQLLSAGMAAAAKNIITAGLAVADTSAAFEAAYAKTQTIMDTGSVSVQQMEADILSLSTATGMAAVDVSEAVYQAISGSVATADAVSFVNDANMLAVAGFTSLTNATDILTTTLNAYGLSADKVGGISNVLIRTQNLGKTSVDELSSSMGKAIATGSAYGVGIENISTSYVELTKGGIATAEATTYLSGMLNELGNSGSKVGKIILEETGRAFGQLMSNGWSLADVLQVLYTSVNEDSEALMGLWGSQEAGKASNAIITQGLEDFNATVRTMRAEMEGATGTVQDAYDTMTNTAEFIDAKFENSIKNLGISFGKQLLPGITAVKSTIADMADGLADIVADSPVFAASVEAAAVGAGVLTIGLTATSLATGVLKQKFIELQLVMMTNPWILAASAIAAVTVAVVSLAASAKNELDPTVQNLNQSVENLNETLDEGQEQFNTEVGNVEAAASVAESYIQQLEELDAVTDKTAGQTALYNQTLQLLAATVPELAEYIDIENGAILTTYENLRLATQGWKENAIAQAQQARYTELYRAFADAVVKRQVVESKLAATQEKRSRIEAQMAAEEEIARQKAAELGLTLQEAKEAGYVLGEEYDALSLQLRQLAPEEAALSEALGLANQAADEAQTALDELDAAFARVDDSTASAADRQAGMCERLEATVEAAQAAGETLQAAYDAAYEAAYASIDKQIGLFDDMTSALDAVASATNKDAQDMIKSLDSQLEYMATYAENMRKAAEMGISDGLLQQLSDGSAESAEILAGLVTMSEEQVAEMNEKFAAVAEGKGDFAEAMTEYTGVVEEEKEVIVDLAAQIGIDMSGRMTSELLNGLGAFEAALSLYTNSADQARLRAQRKVGSIVGIPGYATGTDYAATGYALVGEEGPELVFFRGGERVLTNEETQSAMRSIYSGIPQTGLTGATAPAAVGGAQTRQEIHIYVPLEIDGREFAHATAEYMGEEMMTL